MLRQVALLAALAFASASDPGITSFSLNRGTRRAPHPNARRLDEAPTEEVPILGDFRELAYYYADVFVGTPPQKFTVITDTGSTLLAFPCKGCSTCGAHMDPKFDVSKSSSVQSVPCGSGCSGGCSNNHCSYSQSYAEGSSLGGVYYEDQVWLGGLQSTVSEGEEYGVRFRFGCHTRETKLFVTQAADGIMGLSQDSKSLISVLQAHNKLTHHMFTMCLTMDGGEFVLGGMDTSMHTSPVKWTPLKSSRSFYTVTVNKVQLEGTTLSGSSYNGGSHGTIVDSGTTFTYLPKASFDSLKSYITSWCSASSSRCKGTTTSVSYESLCYRLSSPSDLATFPSMTIELPGVHSGETTPLLLTPERLFVNMDWDNGAYCLGVYSNGGSGGVIGANAMMGHDVVFDLETRRVGFAPSECIVSDVAASPAPSLSPAASPSPAASASPSESLSASSSESLTASASASVSHSASESLTSSASNSLSASASTSPPPLPSGASQSASTSVLPTPTSTATATATATTSVSSAPGSSTPSATPTASTKGVQLPIDSSINNGRTAIAATPPSGSSSDFLTGLVIGLTAFVALVVGSICYVYVLHRDISIGPLRLSSGRQRYQDLERGGAPVVTGVSADISDDEDDAAAGVFAHSDIDPLDAVVGSDSSYHSE